MFIHPSGPYPGQEIKKGFKYNLLFQLIERRITRNSMSKISDERSLFSRFGYQLIRISVWLAFKTVFRFRIYGSHHFPASGAALICSNHQSHLDPMLVGVSSTRRCNFLAKKQLFRYPPLSWVISFLDSIPIDREGPGSISGMKETLKRLKRGEMVVMFPEGTRSETGEMLPIMPGFVAFVRRVRAPVIPVGIDGAQRAWPKNKKLIRPFTKVNVVVGQPIPPNCFEGKSDDEVMEIVASAIRHCVVDAKSK